MYNYNYNQIAMKWTYFIIEKIKVAIALAVVLVLVLATNMMDKSHFLELQDSFASVYKDRLVVESYIYKLSGQVHKKKLLFDYYEQVDASEFIEKNQILNDTIADLIQDYEKTKLTTTESKFFSDLKMQVAELEKVELKFINSSSLDNDSLRKSIGEYHQKIAFDLDKLSDVQLSEARNIIDNSKRLIASSNIASQLEICVLILIGFIIQVLIFASKSITTKMPQDRSMN